MIVIGFRVRGLLGLTEGGGSGSYSGEDRQILCKLSMVSNVP